MVIAVNITIPGLHNCHRLEIRNAAHVPRVAGHDLPKIRFALAIDAINLGFLMTASSSIDAGVCFGSVHLLHWDQLNLTHWL